MVHISEKSNAPCLELVKVYLQVALSPADTNNPMGAVKRQLNTMLFKYDEKFAGIPICFGEFAFPPGKENGKLLADQPWVHVDIISQIMVFKPTIGNKVIGRITKVSDNHVALLIYSLFNASIPVDEMKKHFTYNYSSSQWDSKSQGSSWKENDEVEFTIGSYQYANSVVNIVGKI